MKDLLAPLAPYWTAIKWAVRIGFLLSVFLTGCWVGGREGMAEVAALKLAHAKADAKSAQALAKATQDAREKEHEMGDRFIAASLRHQGELRRVQGERDALRADLLAGRERLQDRWAGCVSATAAGRPGVDAGAADRAASASRIVGAAAECDAQVRGLQAIVKAERAR